MSLNYLENRNFVGFANLNASSFGSINANSDTNKATQNDAEINAGAVKSQFDIELKYSGDETYRSAFERAISIWENVITGDLPNVQTPQGVIDDLLLSVDISYIDGPGNTLGRAGPAEMRSVSDGGLPYSGFVQLDQSDMASLSYSGTLLSTAVHEIGHVLGFGAMWSNFDLTRGYQYIGENAVREYSKLLGYKVSSVPIESEGGYGTAGYHWDEFVFKNELMTGYAESQNASPLSTITIGSLDDLGYQVNYAAAEAYDLPSNFNGNNGINSGVDANNFDYAAIIDAVFGDLPQSNDLLIA